MFCSAGSGSEEMDCRYSYSENNTCILGACMKIWNLEFKYAGSAAHAAAAEGASMAARGCRTFETCENKEAAVFNS